MRHELLRAFFASTVRNEPLLTKLSVRYNSTPYSYLTSAAYSDTASFLTGANVISVDTLVPDGDANTGLAYDFDNEYIIVKQAFNANNKFYNRARSLQFTVTGIGGQGIAYDQFNDIIIEYMNNDLHEINLAGVNTYNQNDFVPSPYNSGMIFYNPFTGEIAVSSDNNQVVRFYKKTGGTWVYQGSTWFNTTEGIGYDFTNNKFVILREMISLRPRNGMSFENYAVPTVGIKSVSEGIFVDPQDGTVWFNSDENFHGSIVNGNRTWHTDPRGVYQQYIRFPDMITFDKWKITGSQTRQSIFNGQKIKGYDWAISPVIDFGANTGQQTAGNWSTPDNVDKEFRGSGTAPTTTATAATDPRPLPYYDANQTSDGWGATVPGSWQSTPTTNRYMQIRVRPKPAVPVTPAWTPARLGSKLVYWYEPGDRTLQNLDVYNNTSDLWLNMAAVGSGNAANAGGTAINPRYNSGSPGYARIDGSRFIRPGSGSALFAHTQGEWNIVGRRESTGIRAPWVNSMNTGTDGSQLRLWHYPSGGGTAHMQVIEMLDAAGATLFRAGYTENTTTFKLFSFGCEAGVENYIYTNKVKQTLSVQVGSNTGKWYADIASQNDLLIGIIDRASATYTGDQRYRLMVYTNAPLTTQERSDLYDYANSKSYFA